MIFVYLLVISVTNYLYITYDYLERTSPGYEPLADQPCLLTDRGCAYFQHAPWTCMFAIWAFFNLCWCTFLAIQQTIYLTRNETTNEFINKDRYRTERNRWRDEGTWDTSGYTCMDNCRMFWRGDGIDWQHVYETEQAKRMQETWLNGHGGDHVPLMHV
jgi:hypothetical protein